MRRILRPIRKSITIAAAVAFAAQIGIALFGIPSTLNTWLTSGGESIAQPRYVIVLGGGGIPSESGLIRTYYAAQAGSGRTGVTFIVALPADQDPATSSVGRMRDELVLRGIPRESILMEHRGRNTREQASEVRRMLGSAALDSPLLVVTSPYHVRRSLLCFRAAGFRSVDALAAEGIGAEADMGGAQAVRYSFWSNLETEVRFARELAALFLYRVRGWI